ATNRCTSAAPAETAHTQMKRAAIRPATLDIFTLPTPTSLPWVDPQIDPLASALYAEMYEAGNPGVLLFRGRIWRFRVEAGLNQALIGIPASPVCRLSLSLGLIERARNQSSPALPMRLSMALSSWTVVAVSLALPGPTPAPALSLAMRCTYDPPP